MRSKISEFSPEVRTIHIIKAVQELYHRHLGVDREVASVKAENAKLRARLEKIEKSFRSK